MKVDLSKIPKDVIEAMKILHSHGYQAYIVGGAVRDLLLGKSPSDYDIATDATPEEVMKIFEQHGWKAVPTGIEFGTVLVLPPSRSIKIEVTTFRKEMYKEERGRKPIVSWAKSLREDVERRDFTINALAIDIHGNVIDYVGGVEDLRRGIIRFVGNPDERIREDPLRMLRALRFAAKLGFTIDPETFEAIKRNVEKITRVSMERIRDEILKAAETKRFHKFIELLYKSGLYRYIIPELEEMNRVRHHPETKGHHGETVFEHTLEVLKRLDEVGAHPELKIAALLHDIGKIKFGPVSKHFHLHEVYSVEMAREILRRLRFSNREIERITKIIEAHMIPINMLNQGVPPEKIVSRLIAKYGDLAPEILIHAYADTGNRIFLELAREARERLRMMSTKPLVTGSDLLKLFPGRAPGPWIKELKEKIFEIQIRKGLKNKYKVIEEAVKEGVLPKEVLERINVLI